MEETHGTLRTAQDGSTYVDHSGHSQGACTMMIATDDETTKRNGWEFMKWWVSTEAQVRFGREIEAILGSSARYATANLEAIEQLAWSEEQLAIIREQMQWAIGFREIAGGYYTNRHLTNAVRKVTNEKTDPRETLLDYARTINEEIEKKREEFGLPVPD
jgi:ABC-type glycerol-3-phosphate transport system substrate-binding protein